jgi:hypothetical protein
MKKIGMKVKDEKWKRTQSVKRKENSTKEQSAKSRENQKMVDGQNVTHTHKKKNILNFRDLIVLEVKPII